jgi:hypothetical protein
VTARGAFSFLLLVSRSCATGASSRLVCVRVASGAWFVVVSAVSGGFSLFRLVHAPVRLFPPLLCSVSAFVAGSAR